MIIRLRSGRKLHISDGNRKMGAIPSFSLPPGRTCSPEAKERCFKEGCYARNMDRRFPNVKSAWEGNLEAVEADIDECQQALSWYFDSPNAPRLFRIHVGGDFYSLEYFLMWVRIAESHPHTVFMGFTKQFGVVMWRIMRHTVPDNLILIASAWPGLPLPEWAAAGMPIAYMQDGTETRVPDDAHFCDGDCTGSCKGHCWKMKPGDSVVFEKH